MPWFSTNFSTKFLATPAAGTDPPESQPNVQQTAGRHVRFACDIPTRHLHESQPTEERSIIYRRTPAAYEPGPRRPSDGRTPWSNFQFLPFSSSFRSSFPFSRMVLLPPKGRAEWQGGKCAARGENESEIFTPRSLSESDISAISVRSIHQSVNDRRVLDTGALRCDGNAIAYVIGKALAGPPAGDRGGATLGSKLHAS